MLCAVDDECGTNYSSTLGKHVKSDECLYVGEGILSKIVTFGGKLYANIAGKADDTATFQKKRNWKKWKTFWILQPNK